MDSFTPSIVEDVSPNSSISIPVGITVGLLASFVQSLGLTIQRKSHVLNQSLPAEEQKVEHRRPLWLLGFGIFISSNLFGSIFQIASLPVVILAPLGAVSLLWNAFFARILLGDAFSIWMVIGTLLIAGGAVLIAVFGIVPEPTHTLEDLLVLFSRPAFIAYFSLLGVFTLVCLAITHIVEYSYSRTTPIPTASPPLSPLLAPNTAPSLLTTAATPTTTLDPAHNTITERTPLIDRKPSRASSTSPAESITSSFYPYASSNRTPILLAMSYASFSGILSGMCLLFAKSGVELLVLTIGGKNQFWRWQAWLLVIGLIIFALLQLWYMHKGLKLANPTLVCPLAFCFYNLSSIINGLVYFDQFSLLSTTHLLLVVLGIFVLLAGVWIVSFPPSGGIQIGGWDDSEAGSVVAVIDRDEEVEVYDDEPLPMVSQRQSTITTNSPEPLESGVGLGITHEETERERRYKSLRISTASGYPSTHIRSQTDSIIPSHSAATSPATLGPHPSNSYLKHTQTVPARPGAESRRPRSTSALAPSSSLVLSPHSSQQGGNSTVRHSFPYPFPLSPGATPGTVAGFSIGLSPLSPGFALVPRDRSTRRKRVESATADLGGTARRVVSDTGVRTRASMVDQRRDEEDAPLLGDGEYQRRGRSGAPLPLGSGVGDRARARWRWLRGIFPGGK